MSKHTLRFWEKELSGTIVPQRTRGGQRRYSIKHILIVEEIKRLKSQGLSLTQIRQRLNNNRGMTDNNKDLQNVEGLAEQIAEIVKQALYKYFNEGLTDERSV